MIIYVNSAVLQDGVSIDRFIKLESQMKWVLEGEYNGEVFV